MASPTSAPPPGPASYIVYSLSILNLIDNHNNEALSHLLTKLDTQTSATSKGFECAPLGTNFVVPVSSPSIVEVATRKLPVTIHLLAKTEMLDYLGKSYKKVLAIHKKLPPRGILIFVTGQREVDLLLMLYTTLVS